MKRILSLDWDYFIEATAEQRITMFPDGGNEDLFRPLQHLIWSHRYEDFPAIYDIGVSKDFDLLTSILHRFIDRKLFSTGINDRAVSVAVSHRWIYDLIKEVTEEDEEFEVYNVDFHHDMYCYKTEGQEVNCGNWVNCSSDIRPNMKYMWVKREDSEDTVIGGVPVSCPIKTLDEIKYLDFDYVYLCRSDCWSPPHLDSCFDYLVKLLGQYLPVSMIEDVGIRIRR